MLLLVRNLVPRIRLYSRFAAAVAAQRHIERSLPDTAAVVLKRNNSENRLEAATTLTPGSSLVSRLVGAEPRSCLALRFGRTHREDPGRPPLPSCELCVDPGSRLTCEQLLVGGQVIGSVLVTHQQPLEEDQETLIKNSVAQAAPVLANLRNLAWPSSAPTTTR